MSIGDWRDAVTPLADQHARNDEAYGDANPPRGTLAGNYNDNDGTVISSFTQENTDASNNMHAPADTPTTQPERTPDAHTRIIGGTMFINSGTSTGGMIGPTIATPSDQPVMILAADAKRLGFGIRVNSFAGPNGTGAAGLGSDELRWASSKNEAISRQAAPTLATASPINNDLHTGPVWIFAPETNNAGAGGSLFVSYYAITE